MRLTVALAVVTTLALGCQHSERRYLDREVRATELPGEWVVTPETVHMFRDEWKLTERTDSAFNRITLRADGTCALRTHLGPAPPAYYSLDDDCRWKLAKTDYQHIIFSGSRPDHRSLSFNFGTAAGGELAIWQYADDPDQWRYIEYVKRGHAPSPRVQIDAQTLPRELHVSSAQREVAPGVHVSVIKGPGGEARAFQPDDVVLFAITAYAGSLTTVAASAEESRWDEAPRSWRLALSDISFGEVRRVWLCDPEEKKAWGDLAKDPCVVADYELVQVTQRKRDDA